MTERLYTRYPFSAAAELIDRSGAQMPSRVTNISFGGCRLIATGRLALGAEVAVKIHTLSDYFEAPAVVIHSTATDLGVMLHNVSPVYFTVLRRWIGAISSATPKPRPQNPEIGKRIPLNGGAPGKGLGPNT